MSEIELTGEIEIGTSEEQAYVRTNSRIDNIIANNNDTEGNSELIDIRIGTDGVTYTNAGTAVRAQIHTMQRNLNQIKDQIGIWNTDMLSNQARMEKKAVFASFPQHINNMSTSTAFKAFATRYSYNGFVSAVDIYGIFYSLSDTCTAKVQLFDGSFENLLAETTITATGSQNAQMVRANFVNSIKLNGNYYIVVHAISEDGYFRANNLVSGYSTADASFTNKYLSSERNVWSDVVGGYDIDVILYSDEFEPIHQIDNIVYIGSQTGCHYGSVQEALDDIEDDSDDNPYIFYIMPGTYNSFSMLYNADRSIRHNSARHISLIGFDVNRTVFEDNRGNYNYPAAEIWTNGVVRNITFINQTDAEHHTQAANRTMAYAVHSDFGTCNTRFENCVFRSNAGPAIGIGTWKDELIEFYNCRFIADGDGTFGDMGHGAFFCHTCTQNDATDQRLIVHDCIAVADKEPFGARLAVISGYTGGSYEYELQNFGSFGREGASVSLTENYEDLLSSYCFNNTPSILNR